MIDLPPAQVFLCCGEPRSPGVITCLLMDTWDTALGF